jgi:hypothetical protein
MGDACLKPSQLQKVGHSQFSLRQMFIATTGIATVCGLATWGGWICSDAVVYLSIAVVAAAFSSTARRALRGGCVILGAFWLAMVLGEGVFGSTGGSSKWPGPLSSWIFAGFLMLSAMVLRRFTKAGAFSLAASLVLAEVFTAIMIVYICVSSTLFEAFDSENRRRVLIELRAWFPTVEQWLIVVPWLTGIVLGELLTRHKKAGDR